MAFECKIAADSLAPCGARLTTFIVTYPRAIHSEIMTHRMLSKSSASSRAIPVEKLIERVLEDPWVPDYIGKNQKGMQPGAELAEDVRQVVVKDWLDLRDQAVMTARLLADRGVHKGVVNRILEPWMWITVIISGTEWDNFFGLRTHEAAEPHFQHIARMMHNVREASEPTELETGDWHLPLIYDDDWVLASDFLNSINAGSADHPLSDKDTREMVRTFLVKVSVGRCARVSYLNHEGKRDLQADIELHDRLMVQRPLHAAPAEHVAQAMDWPSWFDRPYKNQLQAVVMERRKAGFPEFGKPERPEFMADETAFAQMHSGNYFGFKQYRKTLADENIGGLMP